MMHFSLRDIFWLVLATGISLGWWVQQVAMKTEIETLQWKLSAFREVLRRDGYRVEDDDTEVTISQNGSGDIFIMCRDSMYEKDVGRTEVQK